MPTKKHWKKKGAMNSGGWQPKMSSSGEFKSLLNRKSKVQSK